MSSTLIHFQDEDGQKQMLIDLGQISYGVYSPADGEQPSAIQFCMVGSSFYHRFTDSNADLLWTLLKERAGVRQ